MDADKLVKAKESRVRLVGEKDRDVKAKNIADLSPEEYEKWKKENLNNGGRFNKSRTI
jgi:ferredoxin-fold anticodon binding domain-containing protein